MAFLDEKIAKLQKQTKQLRDYENIQIEVSKEVTESFKEPFAFETTYCFEDGVSLPILKDFFEEYQEESTVAIWSRKGVLSILMMQLEMDATEGISLEEYIKEMSEQEAIYIEITKKQEEVIEGTSQKQVVWVRMFTVGGEVEACHVILRKENKLVFVSFNCMAIYKATLEEAIIYMGNGLQFR